MAKVRVGVIVNGKFRRLLSIAENKVGELTIGIQSAESYKFEPNGPKILQQKYTGHLSPNSEIYNTITHTLKLEDGTTLRSYSLTDALKAGSGFAHLFSRRCPDLSNDRYLLKNQQAFVPVILTRHCDPKTMTPIHAVFVGHTSQEFVPPKDFEFKYTEIVFREFRLLIIHTAFALPSHWTGDFAHSVTFRPEEAPPDFQDLLRKLMRGWTSATCVVAANHIFRAMFSKYLSYLLKTENFDTAGIDLLKQMANSAGITIPKLPKTG